MNPIYFLAAGYFAIIIWNVLLSHRLIELEDRMWVIENFMDILSELSAKEADHGEEE